MGKMMNAKFKVEKVTSKNKISLWKLKVRDFLVQQGLHKALDGVKKKHTSMTNSDWEDLDARALSTIRLCLADEALFNIVEERTTLVVGALLSEEVQRKSSIETSAPEAMIARGRSKERGEKARGIPYQNQRARIVRRNVGTTIKLDTSRKIFGNEKNLKTQRRKKIKLIQTVGMGHIKIRMYDNTIITLTNVRHVPKLKKILISLGVLDLDGYKFTGENGVLKVSKGTLAVMKVEKVKNIYRLKGGTQVSEAAIVS
eukprot:PITA_36148